MPTIPYSTEEDFLTGKIPIPQYIDQDKILADTADEMDSHIGFIYKTPVDMTETPGTTSRPARLLLKRISAHLSSGRLIMAADSSGQNQELQSYGIYLVREAMSALAEIKNGNIILDGAEKVPAAQDVATGPLIANVDAESNVEAFYDRVANPKYYFSTPPIVL